MLSAVAPRQRTPSLCDAMGVFLALDVVMFSAPAMNFGPAVFLQLIMVLPSLSSQWKFAPTEEINVVLISFNGDGHCFLEVSRYWVFVFVVSLRCVQSMCDELHTEDQ